MPRSKQSAFVKPPQHKRYALIATVAYAALVGVLVIVKSFAATSSTGAVPVPATGMYWGGTNTGDTNPNVPGCPVTGDKFDLLECKVAWAGHAQSLTVAPNPYHSTMQHFYMDCSDNDNQFTSGSALWQSAHTTGRKVILLSLHCGSTWNELASSDPAILATLKHKVDLLGNLGIPVLLVFHHEPEDDSCLANNSFGTPDDYRAASRVFSTTVRAEQTRIGHSFISIGWTLMNFSFNHTDALNTVFTSCGMANLSDAKRTAANWYPGDAYVDWLTPDVYVRVDHTYAQTLDTFYTWASGCPTVHPTTAYACNAALKSAKPLGIAEIGVPADLSLAARTQPIDDMRTVSPVRYSRLKLLAWWGNDGPNQNNIIDLPLSDTSHTVLKAYARTELALKATFTATTATPLVTPTPRVTVTPSPVVSPTVAPTTSATPPISPTPTPPAAVHPDINADGHVNILDLSILLAHWGTADRASDLDGNGIVNILDLSILATAWTG